MEKYDISKRSFLKGTLAVGAFGGLSAIGASASAAKVGDSTSSGLSIFNVRDFGAKGDGKTSDSAAIQKAIDAAGKVEGTVYFPSGKYICAKLKVPAHTTLISEPQWAYRGSAGAILQLESNESDCVIDITGAFGTRISGLNIKGCGKSELKSHGIYLNNDKEFSKKEDAPVIEDCRIEGFTGNAIYLKRVWLFIIRRNICIGNGGAGIRTRGWDGFVSDNQLSGNRGGGYVAEDTTSTVMFTANRVEWNGANGLEIPYGDAWNITGNCFDRNWGCAIKLRNITDTTITGNVFRRNGKDASKLGDEFSCHVYLDGCKGITVSGNSGASGVDDGGKGNPSPKYAFSTKALKYCAITSNAMFKGFTEKMFLEIEPNEECAISCNVGCARNSKKKV